MATPPTRKIRKSQILTRWGEYDLDPLKTGARRYVIAIHPVSGSTATYRLSETPGKTNMSHEDRVDGWLGMTNNVNYYAEGFYEVTGESSTHLHLIRLDTAEVQ